MTDLVWVDPYYTGFMAKEVAESFSDPLEALEQRRREQLDSLQLLRRDIDERSEQAWAAAIETLGRLYHNAAERLKAAAKS